jgi:hypothetical protein
MNKLSEQEFNDRAMALQRARKIFIESGLTNNITVAFAVYQTIFAEREREIFLDTMVYGNAPKTVMDRYERPKCPDCNSDFKFRQVDENPEGVKTQLVCSNTECDTVLNSENDLQWWMENLKKNEYERPVIGVETGVKKRRPARLGTRPVRRPVPHRVRR